MAKEKDKDDDEKGKEPELVIVTGSEKDLEAQPGPQTDDDEVPRQKAKDQAPVEDKDDDQDDEPEEEAEEARLGESEEIETEQERKKSAHKSRRQRQKDAERRLRTERDFLERRNEAVEKELLALKKRVDTGERSRLEERINYTKSQIAKAERIHADATTAGKGDEATEALKIRDNMRESLKGMEDRRTAMDEEDKNPPQQEVPKEVIQNAQTWMGRTRWFDPHLRDQDSRVVRALDISIGQEGVYDPGSPEYFEELDRRIAKYLPHRAGKKGAKAADASDEDVEDEEQEETPTPRKKGNGKTQKPSGGPRFRTGASGRDLRDNEVFLSPERIAALKEVGAWDDPVLRQKYLKKYQAWDQENPRE